MADVFISYAREDRAQAESLARLLERDGWSVWWDRKLRLGKAFPDAIERELNAARCVVVLWSRSSVHSEWVAVEATEGARRGVLVPAILDDSLLPLQFRLRHTARLVNWNPPLPHPGVEDFLAQLRELFGRTASVPTHAGIPTQNHSHILRAGSRTWNEWRAENPHVEPLLVGAGLMALDLSAANLAGANLANADLSLSVLDHADMRNAILAGANLSETRLRQVNFKDADLSRTDLCRAVFDNTILVGARLAGAKHLESTVHLDTSHIDHRMLSSSPGLAAHFLRGCGLTDREIAAYEQRVHG